jgi:alpha-maltose-1-phosphate synthase
MRFSNASFAYFGLFLSREMHRLGFLDTLYTNLPWTRFRDLPRTLVRSMPLLAAPMALRKLGLPGPAGLVEPAAVRLFDQWVSASLSECDVFHCFSGFGLRAFEAARSRFGAVTVVERGSSHIRFQRDILVEEHARWRSRFTGISERALEREEREYEECDRITVQSTFAERTFRELGVPESKLLKLPLGVDLGLFHPVPKRDDVFRVLYAGHCSLRKGIPYLLQAVAELRLPNFEFVINGAIGDDVRDIMGRHARCFRFLGHQPLARLHEVYSQASVLVLPTLEDGFAKVVTEAMACGVPVIATTNCGAQDVLTDGLEGFIVPIRDPGAIRERILYLYENPEVQAEMGRAALERAREFSDVKSYGLRAAAVYRDVLAQVRGEAVAQH